MQSVFTSHLLDWLTVPEAAFVAGFFLLSATVLFALALEAGTYPEVEKGFRRLRKLRPYLHSSSQPNIRYAGGRQASAR